MPRKQGNRNVMIRYQYLLFCMIALTMALMEWGPASVSAQEMQQVGADDEVFMRLLSSASESLQRDQLAEAERLFTRALEMYPQSREARFGMGALMVKQGRDAQAAGMLEQLMEDYPDDFSIINTLAWLYATASDYSVRNGQRAVALAQKALLLQPNNFHVWNTLSEGHYVSGDYERALRAARETLRLSQQAHTGRDRIRQYERQVEKCRRAAEALSILE